MKITRIGFFSLIVSIVSAASASAAGLSGTYHLNAPCAFKGLSQSFMIPAGNVTVTENVPVRDLNGTYPTIIFQVPGAVEPRLALPVGIVEQFAYGAHPFSAGTYNPQGARFMETYFVPKTNGGADLLQTIRIEPVTGGFSMITVDARNAQSVCFFAR